MAKGRSVANEVDRGLGVMADFFHVDIEDGSVAEALRLTGDELQHIHLADSNLQVPSTGYIEFLDVVRTVNSLNYQGYFVVDSLPVKPDCKNLIRDSIALMKQVEPTVTLQEKIDNEMRIQVGG